MTATKFAAVLLVGLSLLAARSANGQDRQAPAAPGTAHPTGLDGEKLFATSCGWCHQDGGRAEGRGPRLAGSDRTDEYLINRIKMGKVGAMPAFGTAFSEVQLRAIVAYIRGLKGAQ